MATVGDLIDRIHRGWLSRPDDQPTRFTLDGAIDASVQTITFDPTYLTVEEQELLGPGVIIEIDSELMVCGTVDEVLNTISVLSRGAMGTTAATHADGAAGFISPQWSRKSIFDAIADSVMSLWPELYSVQTSAVITLSDLQPTDVDAEVDKPLWFWRSDTPTSTDYAKVPVTFYDNFPPSATGKAIAVPGGGTGYLVYRKKFTRPTAETDDIQTDLGVDEEWERLLEISAVAHVIAGRAVEKLTLDHLTEQLEAQGVPVGSATRLRDALIRYEEFLRDKAQGALRSRYSTPVVRHNQVFG